MLQNRSDAIQTILVKRLNGANWADARRDSDVGHARAEYEEMRLKVWLVAIGKLDDTRFTPVDCGKLTPEAIGKLVSNLRAEAQSWGHIAARMNLPETRVRKLYADHTGKLSKGSRVSKGGRFVADDERRYRDADNGFEWAVGSKLPAAKGKRTAKK
jgi:hypothetical protein